MVFSLFRSRRRRNLQQADYPPGVENLMLGNVKHARVMPPEMREKLDRITKVFVAEKNWEGLEGLTVTDEMRYTIAAQVAVLALGVSPDYFFDGVRSVLIFPKMIVRRNRRSTRDGFLVTEEDQHLLGEALHGGPIALSWRDVLHGTRQHCGHNVVLHEFAHYLDGLDGVFDGQPLLPGKQESEHWKSVVKREYNRLVSASQHQQATLLDQYGATHPSEFFAVATECFFELPLELRKMHPELYGILQSFYGQDPAAWFGPFEHDK